MRRTSAPKLGGYAGLAALGLLAALALGRPELAVLAAPFAAIVTAGLALGERPDVRVSLALARDRALEHETLPLGLELHARTPVERLELSLELPEGLALAGGEGPVELRLARGERRTIRLDLDCRRWGGYVLGETHLRAHDRFGLFRFEQRLEPALPLKVFPREETLRALVRPAETQVFSGNRVSRHKGEGIEFTDIRPFEPGDRLRRVNWRASARRDALWVNEHHPERNADVILFLDTFAEARRGRESTLDLAVRAAASLASRYASARDRLGFVGFGGVLRWLTPGTGLVQLYRLVDSLLDTEVSLSFAWKGIDLIPARTLPPQALVVALTPLLDERTVGALLDLRARGFDLAVVDVSPVPFAPPPAGELPELAHRLWRLRREALRARYERVGVAVAEWHAGTPLASALEEVTAFRRHAARARA